MFGSLLLFVAGSALVVPGGDQICERGSKGALVSGRVRVDPPLVLSDVEVSFAAASYDRKEGMSSNDVLEAVVVGADGRFLVAVRPGTGLRPKLLYVSAVVRSQDIFEGVFVREGACVEFHLRKVLR
jgi:hypothetical protein